MADSGLGGYGIVSKDGLKSIIKMHSRILKIVSALLLLLVIFSPFFCGMLDNNSAVMLDAPPAIILVVPYLISIVLAWKLLRFCQNKPMYSYSMIFVMLLSFPSLILLAAFPPWILIASLGEQSVQEYQVKVVAFDRRTAGSKGAVYHWFDVTHPLENGAVLSYVDHISSRFDPYDSYVPWSMQRVGARACVSVITGFAGLSWAEWPTRCGRKS